MFISAFHINFKDAFYFLFEKSMIKLGKRYFLSQYKLFLPLRTRDAGLLLTRPPEYIGRYKMVRHIKDSRAEHG